MNILRNYVIPALVLIGILVTWDFTKPRYPADFIEIAVQPPERPNDGLPPWNANEKIFQDHRNSVRKSTLRSLDQAWSSFCEPEGRKNLDQAVTHYFEQRGNQEESYPKRWGDAGRAYIEKEWSTSDDQRIQRLVREHYERGYLDLADFRPTIAKRILPLITDARVAGEPCKS